jgi:hypothetical protein
MGEGVENPVELSSDIGYIYRSPERRLEHRSLAGGLRSPGETKEAAGV